MANWWEPNAQNLAAVGLSIPGLSGIGRGDKTDITKSALFTGAGTPWGGKEHQEPGKPDYIKDPNQVQGFDYAGLRGAMAQGIKSNRARGGQQLRANAAKSNPYGRSSSANTAQALNRADLGGELNVLDQGISRQDYLERVAQMNALNQAMQTEYEAKRRRSDEEDKERKDFQTRGQNVLTLGLAN